VNETIENLKSGSKGLEENMQAARHNFLLRGYFNKKEKEAAKLKEQEEKKKRKNRSGKKKKKIKENNASFYRDKLYKGRYQCVSGFLRCFGFRFSLVKLGLHRTLLLKAIP
jgi:hypothetical protein